jgi:hypothetical protein
VTTRASPRGKRVKAVHAFAEGELSSDRIAAVVSDTKKVLSDGASEPPNYLWQLAVGGGLVGCLLIASMFLFLIRTRLAR